MTKEQRDLRFSCLYPKFPTFYLIEALLVPRILEVLLGSRFQISQLLRPDLSSHIEKNGRQETSGM